MKVSFHVFYSIGFNINSTSSVRCNLYNAYLVCCLIHGNDTLTVFIETFINRDFNRDGVNLYSEFILIITECNFERNYFAYLNDLMSLGESSFQLQAKLNANNSPVTMIFSISGLILHFKTTFQPRILTVSKNCRYTQTALIFYIIDVMYINV